MRDATNSKMPVLIVLLTVLTAINCTSPRRYKPTKVPKEENSQCFTDMVNEAASEIRSAISEDIQDLLHGIQQCSLGECSENPALSCDQIFNSNSSSIPGDYWVQTCGGDIEQVYCAMDKPCDIIPRWPDGNYALQSSTSGCPIGWSEGWRFHDTEDTNSYNYWTEDLPRHVRGIYDEDNIEQTFCVKGDSVQNYGVVWPKGTYCIARKGGVCPSNQFHEGSIFWDDENSSNGNSASGALPDGEYGSDTRIYYCCRNDQEPNVPITLPKERPFILYRFGGTCQSVDGMRVTNERLKFDDEDDDNMTGCNDYHPDDDDCYDDHKIHFCYYYNEF